MEIITSSSNGNIKKLKLLSMKKGRERFGEFIVEGEKYVKGMPKGYEVSLIAMSESYYNASPYERAWGNVIIVKDSVFAGVSDTVNPQGILAVVKKKIYSYNDILQGNPFIIVVNDLQDPGNMGTLLRTADAVCASGVIITGNSVDVYSPKAVRASAGSILNIPVIQDSIEGAFSFLKSNGIVSAAAYLKADKDLYDVDFTGAAAVIIGNESKGLAESIALKADTKIKIPMAGGAESLNASVAAAVIMYEVFRQRRIIAVQL